MSELTILSESNFGDEVLNPDNSFLVYVTTQWCRPARELEPILEQAAEEIKDKIKVGKLDAEAEPQIVKDQKVQSVPTVLLFKAGELKTRIQGKFTKLELMKEVSSIMTEDSPA